MPGKLLKPKPMLVVEPCATCGRAHSGPRDYRRCAVCEQVFCWDGAPQRENWFAVETRPCGSCRDNTSDFDPAGGFGSFPSGGAREAATTASDRRERRVEYRCRGCVTRCWVWFGADWPAIRPLALFIFVAVVFSTAFWTLFFWGVNLWLRSLGIG
ncbi:MAG: hypothetical protein HYR71_09780 [Chloroflexi bacterium]|nr:hypothetical protein [Chloroflexota bacterium]